MCNTWLLSKAWRQDSPLLCEDVALVKIKVEIIGQQMLSDRPNEHNQNGTFEKLELHAFETNNITNDNCTIVPEVNNSTQHHDH